MSRRDPVRGGLLASTLCLVAMSGCTLPSMAPKEHASAALLDSGPREKVTAKQAADVQIALGRSEEEEGKPDEAEAAYLSALKRDPKRADAEVRLAVLLDRKGDAAAADEHFARALRLAPKDPAILCDRGYSFYLRRRWADAEASLRKAIARDPSHARSHNNLGLVLASRGDTEGALKEFALAGCDPADARSNLGLVLAMEGQLEGAKVQFERVLADKPKSASATEGLKAAKLALASRGGELPSLADAVPGDRAPGPDPSIIRTSVGPRR